MSEENIYTYQGDECIDTELPVYDGPWPMYDEIPFFNTVWDIYTVDVYEETGEPILVAPCGDITHYGDELPAYTTYLSCWIRYYRHVEETADDSLGALTISLGKWVSEKQRWQIAIRDSVGYQGVTFWARKNGRGRWLFGSKIPHQVLDYMHADEKFLPYRSVITEPEIDTLDKLSALVEFQPREPYSLRRMGSRWFWCNITLEQVRPPVSKTVRKCAREMRLRYEALLQEERDGNKEN